MVLVAAGGTRLMCMCMDDVIRCAELRHGDRRAEMLIGIGLRAWRVVLHIARRLSALSDRADGHHWTRLRGRAAGSFSGRGDGRRRS